MLRTLRRRLVLLNAVVSGSILLVMAWVSLGVAQQTVMSQYDRDLMRYSTAILSAVRDAREEIAVRVQLPEDYMIYTETDNQQAWLNTATAGDYDDLMSVAIKTRGMVGSHIGWSSEMPSDASLSVTTGTLIVSSMEAGRVIGSFDETFDETGESSAEASDETSGEASVKTTSGMQFDTFYTKQFTSTETEQNTAPVVTTWLNSAMLAEVDGTPYRVSASKVSLPSSQELILIIQDRSEEMSSVMRLRFIFAGCVMGGLTLVGIASLFLSSRSIKPVEQSIKQQHEFVAAASHELRTPVAAIRANAEVLADAELGEFSPYLESVQRQSEHMTRLVADLVDLARADAGEMSVNRAPLDAEEAAEQTVQAMRPLFSSRGVELLYDGQSAPMIGDATRIRQILVILLDNALRYTPGGHVSLSIKKGTKHVALRVADTGIGIPDEEKPRVFDRFYRVDKARTREDGGAGLGLSIAKQLVEQMGGTISLSDNEGGGCVFTVSFKTGGIFKSYTGISKIESSEVSG